LGERKRKKERKREREKERKREREKERKREREKERKREREKDRDTIAINRITTPDSFTVGLMKAVANVIKNLQP
jgi:hypothetical protein